MPSRKYFRSIADNTIGHLTSRNFAIDDGYYFNDWAYAHLYLLTFSMNGSNLILEPTPGHKSSSSNHLETVVFQQSKRYDALLTYLRDFEENQVTCAGIQKYMLKRSQIEFDFSDLTESVKKVTVRYLIVDDLDKAYLSNATLEFSLHISSNKPAPEWTFRKRH